MFETGNLQNTSSSAASEAVLRSPAAPNKSAADLSNYAPDNSVAVEQVNKTESSSRPTTDTATLTRGKADQANSTYTRYGTLEGPSASQPSEGSAATPKASSKSIEGELTESEIELVQQLKARDAEVRAHELAHAAVGGKYAGAPTYTFKTGPDGRRYAVGGEVSIDTSKERTPEETIEKARIIRAAANAPAEPSAQDRRVAALAAQMSLEAQSELQQQQRIEQEQRTEEAAAKREERVADANAESASQEGGASNSEESETPLPFQNPDGKTAADVFDEIYGDNNLVQQRLAELRIISEEEDASEPLAFKREGVDLIA